MQAADVLMSADSAEHHGRTEMARELRDLADEMTAALCTERHAAGGCGRCGAVRVAITVAGLVCSLCGLPA